MTWRVVALEGHRTLDEHGLGDQGVCSSKGTNRGWFTANRHLTGEDIRSWCNEVAIQVVYAVVPDPLWVIVR
jgi:hypothetical protein